MIGILIPLEFTIQDDALKRVGESSSPKCRQDSDLRKNSDALTVAVLP
jgi:hypothetical protein